jgi:hypothetical protein
MSFPTHRLREHRAMQCHAVRCSELVKLSLSSMNGEKDKSYPRRRVSICYAWYGLTALSLRPRQSIVKTVIPAAAPGSFVLVAGMAIMYNPLNL